MQRHLPYTDQQWEADHKADQPGHPLSCPDCNSDVWCHPTDRIVKGALFRYRMCKRCGFWQAADGRSAPVRCWKSEHLCTRPNVEASYVCGHCLTMLTPREPGGMVMHKCGWYPDPGEERYFCTTCGHYYGRESQVPWPSQGSG